MRTKGEEEISALAGEILEVVDGMPVRIAVCGLGEAIIEVIASLGIEDRRKIVLAFIPDFLQNLARAGDICEQPTIRVH